MTMSLSRSIQLTAAALLAAHVNLAAAGTGTDAGCGGAAQPGIHKVALASMAIKTPLYVIQGGGKFSKVELNKDKTTLISNQAFYSEPMLRQSGNGRWMSYSGVLKGRDKTQYWLYDSQNNAQRLLLEHPAWGGGIPVFSPDSKYLAISASHDTRWESSANAGVYVFDIATSSMLSVKLPTTIDPQSRWASVTWSKDGNELLIMARSMSAKNQREYYSYRPSTQHIEIISGHYDTKTYHDIFARDRKEISLSPQVAPRSDVAHTSAFSSDGQWHAYLGEEKADGSYPLNVAGKDRVIKQVALGRYEHCIGKTIFISGWLDEHHLVYRQNALRYFVYNATTGSTAELFGDHDGPQQFTW